MVVQPTNRFLECRRTGNPQTGEFDQDWN